MCLLPLEMEIVFVRERWVTNSVPVADLHSLSPYVCVWVCSCVHESVCVCERERVCVCLGG